MRLGCASLLVVAVIGVYAAATFPSIKRSATVVEGTVISNTFVRVVDNESYKWQLWKADIRVSKVIKQDRELADCASLDYGQDHKEEFRDGKFKGVRIYTQACPGRPEVTLGMSRRFYCVSGTVGDDKDILMIPEGGWVEELTTTPRP